MNCFTSSMYFVLRRRESLDYFRLPVHVFHHLQLQDEKLDYLFLAFVLRIKPLLAKHLHIIGSHCFYYTVSSDLDSLFSFRGSYRGRKTFTVRQAVCHRTLFIITFAQRGNDENK